MPANLENGNMVSLSLFSDLTPSIISTARKMIPSKKPIHIFGNGFASEANRTRAESSAMRFPPSFKSDSRQSIKL